MPNLLSLGECMVELYADMPLAEATSFKKSFGGDTLNTLVAASRLGTSTGFLTRLGDDPFQRFLLESWHREGIDTSRVRTVPRYNGLYFVSLLEGGEREFVYYRWGSAASTIEPSDLDEQYIGAARILHVSGISQAISSSALETVYRACQIARERGVLVSYDPNYREPLWGSIELARTAFRELLPLVNIALPSLPEESNALLGTTDCRPAAEALWREGVEIVVFKTGPDGAIIADRALDECRDVPALPTKVVDTTGAGDAFNGGLLHGLIEGMSLDQAVRIGIVMAGLKVRSRGAITSLPTKSEVEEALLSWDR